MPKTALNFVTVLCLVAAGTAYGEHERMTLDQAAKRVERQTNGHILDARDCEVGGRVEQCFKVLTRDGRVRKIYVDSQRQLRSQGKGRGRGRGTSRRDRGERR